MSRSTYNLASAPRAARISTFGKACRSALGVGALLLLSSGSVLAQRIHVVVNGSPVHFGAFGPLQLDGRTMVPVRGVLEQLGAEVAWVEASQTVVASAPHMQIQLALGDHDATVNDRHVPLDVPAQIVNGHTMVPLRFLGEALGADVRWDDPGHTVYIVTHDRRFRDRPDNMDPNRRPNEDRRGNPDRFPRDPNSPDRIPRDADGRPLRRDSGR